MTDKQLINSVENCVEDSLRGFSKLRPDLFVDFDRKVVLDAKCCAGGRVALVSGGGSGHEPFPAGYVGEGMLTASVSGAVFESPPSRNVLRAVRLAAAAESSGVLLLVPNYTGDVLNFGLAAETALGEGVRVESVVVGEDASQGEGGKAGKRGMCGLVLAIKVAGHLARIGRDLDVVKKFTVEALRSTASAGLCVSACCKPGVGPLFRLEDNEVEVGVGVHGEAGTARVMMLSARDAVETLLKFVLPSVGASEGDEVVALLNNLGSLSCLEQWLLAGELQDRLAERKIEVVRLYAGHFFTSLNMAGFQVCVMKLSPETKETLLEALDHSTTASAWPSTSAGRPGRPVRVSLPPLGQQRSHSKSFRLAPEGAAFLKRCLLNISEELSREKVHLNYLDSACGDGDCGTAFGRVAALVKASADASDFSDPVGLLFHLGMTVEELVGGTTGALYGLFLKGCGAELEKINGSNEAVAVSKCWRAGVETIKKYSCARIGDRTMLDSLETGCRVFESEIQRETAAGEAFGKALTAAKEGCQRTKFMEASAGRASYVDRARLQDVDAGAYAVTVWLSAIQRALEGR